MCMYTTLIEVFPHIFTDGGIVVRAENTQLILASCCRLLRFQACNYAIFGKKHCFNGTCTVLYKLPAACIQVVSTL